MSILFLTSVEVIRRKNVYTEMPNRFIIIINLLPEAITYT